MVIESCMHSSPTSPLRYVRQGPTGSGKSSLLMVLAGRVLQVKKGLLSGELQTNGHPRDPEAFKKISAFVRSIDGCTYAIAIVVTP